MIRTLLAGLALAGFCAADQQLEVGVGGGYGFSTGTSITRGGASADTGFKPGPAFTVFLDHKLYSHLGGGVRYTLQQGDAKLSAGGTEVKFGGRTHSIHYDFLIFPGSPRASMRPFLAVGAGAKVYQGTGAEHAVQPLSQFAILTKTKETKGLISVGGGLEFAVGGRIFMRTEVRDYLTPVPKKVITPIGEFQGNWMHNFVPTVAIGFGF